MKDIADANHYAFSPNPWFIAAFFSGQAVLQLYWIRKLFTLDPEGYQALASSPAAAQTTSPDKDLSSQEAVQTAIEYAPIYALGNLCIGTIFSSVTLITNSANYEIESHGHIAAGWLFFWLKESFTASQLLVTINTAAQLYAVSQLPPLKSTSHPLLHTTHLVAKTFAGIGILDFVDNGAVALRYSAPPSTLVQILTYAAFPLATALSKPLFGSILVYDLVAIFVGQRYGGGGGGMRTWGINVGWTALASGIIVAFKSIL
ncbi:hypothetical protein NLI96_g1896 [Meripilus lineatus]|uniref:Uncharacterized protein n=1 Tax=Meripilus lineatus TaxID=2056292 RepID=A0AAD5YKI0_9APHY|nr:hypothetical protein NLI96_g1896 [Physisporinus lineatus]